MTSLELRGGAGPTPRFTLRITVNDAPARANQAQPQLMLEQVDWTSGRRRASLQKSN